MIDSATVNRILDTAEIVEVIQEFVTLRKRGVNHVGLCPFHNEKTPSFNVSPSKGIFKCFGCGKGGNVVNFIMEHEKLSYPEALKYLARKYHIEISEREETAEDIALHNEIESLLIVTSFAQKYFSEILLQNSEGRAVGLSYFKERGFRDDIIEKFQLGYCPDAKDGFTHAAKTAGYKLDYLVKTGLTVQNNTNLFDRFSGRVIFPIHGLSGRVIGFGARTLKADKNIAKYLNSPESEIYHKSKILYGINHAKKTIGQEDKCYLVEGYTDVISLHQSGIENAVASSGTSLTADQIRLIKRFTKNVTILYDGDPAGIKASLRGIDLVLEEGMNVKVLLFPDNEDPDSFAQKNSATELQQFIRKNERDFISFKTDLLLAEAREDPIMRAKLLSDIVISISVIPDKITRSVYIRECSRRLNIEENIIYAEVQKRILSRARSFADVRPAAEEKLQPTLPQIPLFIDNIFCEAQEKEIIGYLLNSGNEKLDFPGINPDDFPTVAEFIIRELGQDDLEFRNLIYKTIFEACHSQLNDSREISIRAFINHPEEEIRQLAADLLSPSYTLSRMHKKRGAVIVSEEMRLKSDVPRTILLYKRKILELAKKEKEAQLKMAQENSLPFNEQKNLLSESREIDMAIMDIAKKMGNVILK